MTNQIDEAVEMVLSGSANFNADDALRQLDAALQQDVESQAAVLSGEDPTAWVLGGESGGGFFSMARRFVNFYTDALSRELCDSEGGCLKEKYRNLISSDDTRKQVKDLTPTVLDTIGADKSLLSPITIAVYVALWLSRTGLEQWCAQKRTAPPTPDTPPAAA
jgi:hypothetical protein